MKVFKIKSPGCSFCTREATHEIWRDGAPSAYAYICKECVKQLYANAWENERVLSGK